jgi:hypothetical protein
MSQAWRPWRSYAVLHIWNSPKAAQTLPTAALVQKVRMKLSVEKHL